MRISILKLTKMFLVLLAMNASATVRYVDLNCTNATPPFTDWSTAATNIQDAVDISNVGDLILVTNGIYRRGGRIVSGDGTSNRVAVTKAVTLQSINGPAATVIQGYQVPGTTNGPGAVRCVYLTNNAVLIGFMLTNGATLSSAGNSTTLSGGGVRCQASNAVISNCVLARNAAMYGAGMALGTAVNCVFSNNVAQTQGGGGYAANFDNCLFIGNAAPYGGAAAAQLVNVTTLNNCTVYGNSASVSGGGFASLGMVAPSYLWASNCIVVGNTAPSGSNYAFAFSSELTMNYCCTAPMPPTGTANFTSDPLFVNPAAGDFHLQSNSPCINAGSSNVFSTTDLDGNPRLVAGFVDLGVYEFPDTGPVAVIPTVQANYTAVRTNIVVNFYGQIAGHPTASRWTFGDGTVISNQLPNVTHSWNQPGDYVATLWAYNNSYPSGVTASLIIHVLANPVHYVSQSGTSPVPPYLSWATAATNIQDAVNAAYVNGIVLVTNGFYAFGGKSLYGLMNRVGITNQLALRSVNGPAVTTIEGRTSNDSGPVRCVYLSSNATMSGFTLTNGVTGASHNIGEVWFQSGGGVYCESGSTVVSNCVMSGNKAYIKGGGAYSGTLRNCLFVSNSVTAGEGGGATSTLLDCVLIGNYAYDGGGAFSSTLYNCTLVSNSALYDGGGISLSSATNCILYYNSAASGPDFDFEFRPCNLSFCCAGMMPSGGMGNITNEPLFIDVASGNLRLQTNSPCVNAGENAYVIGGGDFDGRPRVLGGIVDMGAYELQPDTSGLFIGWLEQYHLPTDSSADFVDADGDALNNWQEWIAGTVPTNSLSVLMMLSPSNNVSGLKVSWQSVSGKSYFLQRATDLGAQPAFSALQGNIVGQAGTTVYTDTTATNGGPYFYRVGVQ